MTLAAITVPKWGMAMDEGSVVFWHVAEGDRVTLGQEIVDVESPKITNGIESPADGVLRRIVARPGETLPVGGLLGVIADADTADSAIDDFIAGFVVTATASVEQAAAATPKMLEIGLCYLDAGDGPATPAFLVHGFGGDKGNWSFTQSVLAEQRLTMAVDLPGHGGSAKSIPDPSLGGLADVLIAAIGERAFASVHLVGHSLGGAIALEMQRRAPAMVRSLTLIDPAGAGAKVNRGYIDAFLAASRRKEMLAAAKMLFANDALVSGDMVEDLLKLKRLDGVQAALDSLVTGALAEADQRPTLIAAELGCPLLVLWGDADRVVPPVDAPPHEVIAAAGHMPHVEAGETTNRRIADFMLAHDKK